MPEADNPAGASGKPELKDIDPALYRHPGESGALGSLEKAPGFAKLLDLMSDHGGGKAERMVEMASMVRVGPGIYPRLDELWGATLAAFGIGGIPLHVAYREQRTWTLKGGGAGPRAIIAADLLDELPQAEMSALLAMLAGSVRLGNVTNLAAAEFLRWVQDFSGIAGAPALVLSWALENWRRYAAMSADRAAALHCGVESVQNLLGRISGAGSRSWGGVPDSVRLRVQGVEASSRDKDWDNRRWSRFAVAMNRNNLAGLIRSLDLAEWAASGAIDKIKSGQATTPEDLAPDGTGSADPGLAFWGEFAPGIAETDEPGWREKATDIREAAEKGIQTFFKAGEAFLRTLGEDKGK